MQPAETALPEARGSSPPQAAKRRAPALTASPPAIPSVAQKADTEAQRPDTSRASPTVREDQARGQDGEAARAQSIPFGSQVAAQSAQQTSSRGDSEASPQAVPSIEASREPLDRPPQALDEATAEGSGRQLLQSEAPERGREAGPPSPVPKESGARDAAAEERTSIPFGSQPNAQADAVLEAIKAATAATGSQGPDLLTVSDIASLSLDTSSDCTPILLSYLLLELQTVMPTEWY